MKNKAIFRMLKRAVALTLVAALVLVPLSGCSDVRLDKKNPVTITVWHYYNGAIMNAFETMVQSFNNTVGAEMGIIVEGHGYGSVSDLEAAVLSSAKDEVGSTKIPNIFASYADTAYEAERMGILADLSTYFSKKEQEEYLDSYIEEGKIGLNGELRIFPIAKSTEVLMLNDTDWAVFAAECGVNYSDLGSIEALTKTAKLYYEWTDAKTPDVSNDGKAFYGRDSIANMFIIGSKEFGVEIFNAKNGEAETAVDESVMRKIWDNYYVPYISGYFTSYGKFRSDDAKVGDILAYVGSTSSASYFPTEVTINEETHPVSSVILPAPNFENAQKVMVQQGAGMVVTKGTPEEEYASLQFLKWFTEKSNNTVFAALSGYMPVKKDAVDYDGMLSELTNSGHTMNPITQETLRVALNEIKTSELYTNKAFKGGAEARSILDHSIQDKAVADRELVKQRLGGEQSLEQAIEPFIGEAEFQAWLNELKTKLANAVASAS